MRDVRRSLAVVLFTLGVTAGTGHAEELTLGVHPYLAPAEITRRFTPLVGYLTKVTGNVVSVKIGKSYQEHIDAIGQDVQASINAAGASLPARVPDSGPTVASRTCMIVGKLLERCARDLRKRLGAMTPAQYFRKHGPFTVTADLIIHPGPTVGYRITEGGRSFAYLPDHEPALGGLDRGPEWTSGWALANGVDVLFHDAQYTRDEYDERVGWGHSTLEHAIEFARLANARKLVTFHHDPAHDDATLDALVEEGVRLAPDLDVTAGCEGSVFEL